MSHTRSVDVDFWCPIYAAPGWTERERSVAQRATAEWASRVGLIRNNAEAMWLGSWNTAEFAARVYRRAVDRGLASQWIAWMDVVDDTVESCPPAKIDSQIRQITEVLCRDDPDRGLGPAAGPLVRSLADLWRRTRVGTSVVWRSRMAHLWRSCVRSLPWEAGNRAVGRPPSLHDYLENRATAGATQFAIELTAGLHRDEVPDWLYHCGPVSALRALMCDHICWVNDVLSVEREERRGDVHNLVLVLEAEGVRSRRGATERAVEMADERMQAIGLIVDTVPAYQSATGMTVADRALMDLHVGDLRQWVRGSLDFHRISTRHSDYHADGHNPFVVG